MDSLNNVHGTLVSKIFFFKPKPYQKL